MAQVDNRIVSMELQNQQFERNAKESMQTISNLDKSLGSLTSAKALENVDTSSVRGGLDSITDGVEAIRDRFSLLGQTAANILQNITNDAYQAGKNLINAFTLEPIKTGFQEYETQINATQTILANTSKEGTTLEDVNKALNTLNKYADDTIYNFTEMTRNIGTFTAAGVDLQTSVDAIKGIANLAAISGSDSNQASRAMYQLSQAIASGVVNLQDWNSVVNAGMGGKIFQDALIETAEAMGIYVDKSVSFRESISTKSGSGWLTSEVLLQTLRKFTGDMTEAELAAQGYTDEQIKAIIEMGDMANKAATKVKTVTQLFDTLKEAAQSGWTQSWQLIIGDFEQAKEVLTKVSDVFSEMINNSAEARNEVLKVWQALGGRDDLMKSISNAFEGVMSVVTPFKEAMREVFPPITGERLAELTKKLSELTAKFKLSDESAQNLKDTFKGLFSILNIAKKLFGAVFQILSPILGEFGGLGNGILKLTGSIGRFFTSLDEGMFSAKNFSEVIEAGKTIVSEFIKIIKNGAAKLEPFGNAIKDIFTTLKNTPVGTSIAEFFKSLNTTDIKLNPESITDFFKEVGDKFSEFKSKIDFSEVKDYISEKLESIGFTFDNFKDKISSFFDFLSGIKDKIASVFSGLADKFGTASDDMSESASIFTKDDIKDAITTGFLGVLVVSVKRLFGGLTDVFKGTEGILDNVNGVLRNLGGVLKSYANDLNANALIKIAGAIAIIAAAIAGLSLLPFESIANVTVLLGLVGAGILAFLKVFQKLKGASSDSSPLKDFADNVMSFLEGFAAAFEFKVKAEAISILATTLLKFVAAVVVLTLIPVDKLLPAIGILGLIAAELSVMMLIFSKAAKTGSAKDFIGLGVSLTAISVAISILSGVVKKLGNLDSGVAIRGASALAVLLAEVAAFTIIVDKASTSISSAVSILAVSAAISILGTAMALLGQLKIGTIAKGLLGVGGLLLEVAAATKVMSGSLAGAAAMVVIAGALALFIPQLILLGNIKLSTLAIGLGALAATFAIVGVAAYLLSPVTPIIIGLAAALTAIISPISTIIASIALLIASFKLFAEGLVIISEMSTEQIQTLITNLFTIVQGFITMLPQIEQAVVAVVTVIVKAAVDAIVQSTDTIATGLVVLITAILQLLARYTEPIVQAIVEILIACLKVIRDNIKEVVMLVAEIIAEILIALGEAVPIIIDACIKFLIEIIDGLATAIMENAGPLADAFIHLVDACVEVLIQAIRAALHMLLGPIGDVINQLLGGMEDELDINSPSKKTEEIGDYTMEGLAVGIKNNTSSEEAMSAQISDILGVATSEIDSFKIAGEDNGNSFMEGFSSVLSGESTTFANTDASKLLEGLLGQESGFADAGNLLGNTFDSNLSEGLLNGSPEVTLAGEDVLKSFTDSGLTTLADAQPEYEQSGKDLILKVADGIDDGSSITVESVSDTAETSVNELRSYRSRFYQAGSYVMEGFAQGIRDNSAPAIDAATDVARKSLAAAKEELDINSPSGEFRYLGRMSDEGYADGLRSFASVVTDASTEMGQTSMDALRETLGQFSDISFEEFDSNPKITPVVDLSNVISGAGMIDELMAAEHSLSFGRISDIGMLKNLSSISGFMDPSINQRKDIETTDTKTVEAIGRLESRINQLGDAITNMQIVMDTGALVGQISGPIDRSLGRISQLKQRGI